MKKPCFFDSNFFAPFFSSAIYKTFNKREMGNVCGAAKASRKGTIEGEDFHSIYSPLQTREEEVREADVVDVMIKDSDFSHISVCLLLCSINSFTCPNEYLLKIL